MTVDLPLVSVVVTTKNESANIDSCLRSIIGQSYPNIEVIVVDNSSTDDTKAIAKRYTERVFDHGPERSAQRNYGLIELASGEFGMYIDADMILSPSLIEECVTKVANGPAKSLFLPEVILGNSFFNRIRRFERKYYEATPIDAVRFFPIASFVEVGGFDEVTFEYGSGEDWDLDKKLKSVTRFEILEAKENILEIEPTLLQILRQLLPAKFFVKYTSRVCIYHNESKTNFRDFLKKKRYYAKAFDRYRIKWGESDNDVRRQFSVFYRLVVVFFSSKMFLTTLRNPHWYFAVIVYRTLMFCNIAISSTNRSIAGILFSQKRKNINQN